MTLPESPEVNMEHPGIPTLHFDDVPRSLTREVTGHADLTWHFGPRGEGFFGQDLGKVAREKLGMILPDLLTASQQHHILEEAILEHAARGQSHTLLVLQVHPNPVEGVVCLVPNTQLKRVEELLDQVPGRKR